MVNTTIVIGDVHGRIDAFRSLSDAILRLGEDRGFDPFLVLVGDLVDRGPESAAVVSTVRRAVDTGSVACVLGNHDEMMLQNLILFRSDLIRAAGLEPEEQEVLVAGFRFARERVLHHWLSQGGRETIESYGGDPWRPESWVIPPEDVRFLARRPLVWRNGETTVTHARGDKQAIATAAAHQNDPWRIPEDVRYSLLWNRESVVAVEDGVHVCGHTPRRAPLEDGTTREIDTGCAYGGRLTGYIVSTGEYVTIPCSS